MRRESHEMKVGFAGHERTITVEVPEGDARPWDLGSKFRVVGGGCDRGDAVAKVTGRARYADDVRLPGLLHGVLVRSPHAAGVLRGLELEKALDMPGVRAAVALKEVGNRVRYVGDPVAAIAAERLDQALDALAAVVAEFDVEEAVIDFLQARGAPALDASDEVQDAWPEEGGAAIEAALGQCALTRQATWRCEVQTHSSLETHGLVAWHRGEDLEVWASTQATFGTQAGLAEVAGLPAEKVRVHAEFVGGGFGSKFAPGDEGRAAVLLSKAAQAPVKVLLSRFEEHTCAGNRPSAVIQIRAGIDADGILRAWDYRSFGGPGYTGSGGGTSYVPTWFGGAETRRTHRDLATATDAARAMRAPGWPQGNFAAEGMLDLLATSAGIDPLDFRLKNDGDELRQAEWRLGAEHFGWRERRNPAPGEPTPGLDPRYRRGAGLAAAFWGQMGRPGNQVTCRIHADGTVEARNGAQDIGTGMKTVMALLTAEELGIDPSRVRVTMGDTADPVGPASGGSTTTPSLAPTVRHAAWLAQRELLERVADSLGVPVDSVRMAGGKVIAGDKTLTFREACQRIGPNPIEATGRRFRNYDGYKENVCGCQFAEVLVDTLTGVVRATKMLAVQDCGLVIAEKLAESQVLGAMIQGVSYALHEQRILDTRSGRMLNGDLSFYKISGAADVPELEAIMFSVANGRNNVGAAGLGEPPAVAAPAAVANAVSNALGVPMRSLPITPDKVLAAWRSRGANGDTDKR